MTQNASNIFPDWKGPAFGFNPRPAGYETASPAMQAAAATDAYESMRGNVAEREGDLEDNLGYGRFALMAGGTGLGMGTGAMARRMTGRGGKWGLAGRALQYLQAGVPGNLSRWLVNKAGLKPGFHTNNIRTVADYRAAARPGVVGSLARAPMHFFPDSSVPYASRFANPNSTWRNAVGGAGRWVLPTAGAAGALWGVDKVLGNDAEGNSRAGGYTVGGLLGGVDQLPTMAAHNWLLKNHYNEAASNLEKGYSSEEFDRLYRNNLHDRSVLENRKSDNQRDLSAVIMAILGGVFGGIPGAGAGLGLPYAFGALSKPQGQPAWSGGIDAKGFALPGEGGNITVPSSTFARLRSLANSATQ